MKHGICSDQAMWGWGAQCSSFCHACHMCHITPPGTSLTHWLNKSKTGLLFFFILCHYDLVYILFICAELYPERCSCYIRMYLRKRCIILKRAKVSPLLSPLRGCSSSKRACFRQPGGSINDWYNETHWGQLWEAGGSMSHDHEWHLLATWEPNNNHSHCCCSHSCTDDAFQQQFDHYTH